MIVAETSRLIISQFTIDDAPFYLELLNTPKWIKYIGDRNLKTIEDAKNIFRKQHYPSIKNKIMAFIK